MTLEVLSSHRWCWVIFELQAVSVYRSFLSSSGLCAVRTHESAYLRSPWSRWDRGSRTGRGAGCDVRRPPPSWAPSDGRRLRVNCLLSHWHTGQIPASTRPITSICTHAHTCTYHAHTRGPHLLLLLHLLHLLHHLLFVLFLLRTPVTAAAAAVACSSK